MRTRLSTHQRRRFSELFSGWRDFLVGQPRGLCAPKDILMEITLWDFEIRLSLGIFTLWGSWIRRLFRRGGVKFSAFGKYFPWIVRRKLGFTIALWEESDPRKPSSVAPRVRCVLLGVYIIGAYMDKFS